MSNIAIHVENLSKLYKIGARRNRHDTLRDHLAHGFKSLFSRNGRSSSLASQPSTLSGQQSAVSGHPSSVDGRSDTFWALKDVSFEVKQGEVVGVIGRNGAGKSTLLKILSRITGPTEGRARIYGRVGSLLEVGTGFHPELTGRDNIYLNGAIIGMKKAEIERKFDEIVDFSGVEQFIDTPVKRYSSGMYVRLAFAVSAHLEPEIMIVDEVLAVGDVPFQKKCLGKMGDVAKAGRTVLFVSHNLGAVKSLCSRSLLLEGGLLEMDGPSEKLVARYLDSYDTTIPPKHTEKIGADLTRGADGQGFFLYPQGGNMQVAILCGEVLSLEFVVEAPQPLREMTAGITIVSRAGEPVVSMSSKVQKVPSVDGLSRFWKVRCDMGQLRLNAGTYFARVHVGNTESDYARFTQAFIIQVRAHDVFGWGNPLPGVESWGPMYWAPVWDIRPEEEI